MLGKATRLSFTAIACGATTPKLAQYTGKQPAVFMEQCDGELDKKVSIARRVVMLITHGFFLPDPDTIPDEAVPPSLEAASPANIKPPKIRHCVAGFCWPGATNEIPSASKTAS